MLQRKRSFLNHYCCEHFLVVASHGLLRFLTRPWGKEGYTSANRLEVIAFGISMIGIGFFDNFSWPRLAVSAELGYPYHPWRASPYFSTSAADYTNKAGCSVAATVSSSLLNTPYFSGYNLAEAGVTALANELYTNQGHVSRKIELNKISTDRSSSALDQ